MNGAGKSTTFKCITGIQPYDLGSVYINGFDLKTDPILAKQQLGYIPDNHATFEELTGREYIYFMADVYQVSKNLRDERIKMFAKMFSMEEALTNDASMKEKTINIFESTMIHVYVWDGSDRIKQAIVEPTPYMMEEFLVVLDTENNNDEELKVKFEFATSQEYQFDSIHIDFTNNLEMNKKELPLLEALINGEINALDKLNNNEYIALDYKDSLRLGFNALPIDEGYSRGFGVSTSGYVYTQQAVYEDELLESVKGKTIEEIIDVINNSERDELIADIKKVSEFYYFIEQIGSLSHEEIQNHLFNLEKKL